MLMVDVKKLAIGKPINKKNGVGKKVSISTNKKLRLAKEF